MARLDPALAEEIRRLPISRCLQLIQALLDRAGPEVERQWLPVAEDRLADCQWPKIASPTAGRAPPMRCRWPRCSSDWGAERAIAQQQRRPYRGSER
ncbi:hypothetical protein ACP0IR_00885 [Pseudomonas aeruginosa]|uniref:hypothetical protein n=1 Tax=Pseudomonas aeruginosa TaxID=287 RepID=UPI001F1C6BDA|nr:hypothetical protein [Pseudomonas aeruginosa]